MIYYSEVERSVNLLVELWAFHVCGAGHCKLTETKKNVRMKYLIKRHS